MEEWSKVKKELLSNKRVYEEYKKLEPKYKLISQVIGVRVKKGISQKELARRMGTKQSAIARFESGNYNPTIEFLDRTAQALGTELVIGFK